MSDFSTRLIEWQKVHGRHDLPWQNTVDPYAIWVSEIMLQQTQVSAVIGYYSKFMSRFPTISALASASQEEVLQYWSGLGYYSRARNLHKAAMAIVQQHNGVFPQNFETIQTLSGIGRSTAAAIASFAFNQTQTILDGNVKRVLARHFLIDGWTGKPAVEQTLWALAESLLPKENMVAYTQGLMDLGATICSRSKPKCYVCPLMESCAAYLDERVAELPTTKPRKIIPIKSTTMLICLHKDQVLLEIRPNSGIWGGLLSLPEMNVGAKMAENSVETAVNDEENIVEYIRNTWTLKAKIHHKLPSFQHVFTHFKLNIQPIILNISEIQPLIMHAQYRWLPIASALNGAIPAPTRQILLSLKPA